jgi:hypothetical protein
MYKAPFAVDRLGRLQEQGDGVGGAESCRLVLVCGAFRPIARMGLSLQTISVLVINVWELPSMSMSIYLLCY